MKTQFYQCKCIYEPRGDHGLEGYQLNSLYRYSITHTGDIVVYPDESFPEYGERCTGRIFNKYFLHQIINPCKPN